MADSDVTLSNSELTHNKATTDYGGSLWVSGGQLNVSSSVFDTSEAAGQGGAIFVTKAGRYRNQCYQGLFKQLWGRRRRHRCCIRGYYQPPDFFDTLARVAGGAMLVSSADTVKIENGRFDGSSINYETESTPCLELEASKSFVRTNTLVTHHLVSLPHSFLIYLYLHLSHSWVVLAVIIGMVPICMFTKQARTTALTETRSSQTLVLR